MIFTGFAFADTFVFQTRKRWKNIDWRFNALAEQLIRKNNLSFGDVAGKVRDRVRLVVFRHRQNRNHRNRARAAFLSARAFIHRRKVGI